jgi:hypothetical protein
MTKSAHAFPSADASRARDLSRHPRPISAAFAAGLSIGGRS